MPLKRTMIYLEQKIHLIGIFSLIVAVLLVISACSTESNKEEVEFDRTEFLTFLADAQIIPAYQDLNTKAADLNNAFDEFTSGNMAVNQLKQKWVEVAESWQKVHMFDFGPAEGTTGTLGENIATFPISTDKLEAYLLEGDTSFQNFDRDTRGIYAIEYLIYTNEQIDDFNSQEIDYLKALLEHLNAQTSVVYSTWNESYRSQFISNNGTDAGSSLSIFINAFAKSYEQIKNFKLGLPLGLRPGQVQTEPNRVEAYYSDIGLTLTEIHFNALADVWFGNSSDNPRTTLGLEDYLKTVEGGDQLVQQTSDAIEEINASLDSVKTVGSMKSLVEDVNPLLTELHDLFQKHTRFFKSDLASLLGVYITYNSGDGD